MRVRGMLWGILGKHCGNVVGNLCGDVVENLGGSLFLWKSPTDRGNIEHKGRSFFESFLNFFERIKKFLFSFSLNCGTLDLRVRMQ